MTDRDLREAIKRRLQPRLARKPKAFMLEEFSVGNGTGRIDLVLVDQLLHGYELKSDSDNLERLPDQIMRFNTVFDRITLVVAYRHAYAALQMVPEWWGVKLAHVNDRGTVHVSDARQARRNPTQDATSVLSLLWREEAIELLATKTPLDGYRSKSKSELSNRIQELCSLDDIRSFLIDCLFIRTHCLTGE